MRVAFFVILGMVSVLGCARVKLEAPKEPIKVDISMRLDIYQHVVKDIDNIENVVSGAPKDTKPAENKSLLNYFIDAAYAQEGLSPQVQEAALRRRDRRAELVSWQEKGVVGENKAGLVETRIQESVTSSLEGLIKAENSDRMLIYQAVAEKNGTSVEEVQKIYAKRLQQDAPTGTPIEVLNEATGSYAWKIK